MKNVFLSILLFCAFVTSAQITPNIPSPRNQNGKVLGSNGSKYIWTTGGTSTDSYTTAASSSTLNLGSISSNYIGITGTVTINNFGTVSAGLKKYILVVDSFILTASSNIILPSSSTIYCKQNDFIIIISDGSGVWRCISYQKFDDSYINYTPSFTGFSVMPTINPGDCRYKMLSENTCHVIWWPTGAGTSNNGNLTGTLPFVAAWSGGSGYGLQQSVMGVLNNGAQVNGSVRTRTGGSNILDVYNGIAGSSFNTFGQKNVFLNFIYQIQR